MSKRYLMQKAHKYKNEPIGGWYWSEKLDGMRVLWDGGISRGIPKSDVPYANHAKDGRYKVPPIATGLWTQLGNVVHAPDWFLDGLPSGIILGGELWKGYGYRQDLMSAVKKLVPIDSEWEGIKIYCYELPNPAVLFADGYINTPTCKISIDLDVVKRFAFDQGREAVLQDSRLLPFCAEQKRISKLCEDWPSLVAHPQHRLPLMGAKAKEVVNTELDRIISSGGEGIVLRDSNSTWIPERAKSILKIKPTDDAEGIVTGYITGRETDKGSKLLGMMGALILDYKGQRLELSGFTDAERSLALDKDKLAQTPVRFTLSREPQPEPANGYAYTATEWATENPCSECPDWITNPTFPRGTVVSFKHRGFTKSGLPEEARYWRKRLDD